MYEFMSFSVERVLNGFDMERVEAADDVYKA